jgi:Tfp pilus assembly protein PilF
VAALGLANALAGDAVAGERLLTEAIALDPSNALAWYRYALVLLDQGRGAEARQALTTAARLDQDGIVAQLAASSLSNLAEGSP